MPDAALVFSFFGLDSFRVEEASSRVVLLLFYCLCLVV